MEIYVLRENKQLGPYTLEAVNQYIRDGFLTLDDLAWHEGVSGWTRLAEVAGIKLNSTPASAPPTLKRTAYKIIGADGREYGPVSRNELREWVKDNRVNSQTLARTEDTTEWKQLSALPDFADLFAVPFGSPTQPVLSAAAGVSEEELRLFVDKNANYYVPKWCTMQQSGTAVSWNWASPLGGILWMAYRKMYLYMWLAIGFCVGEGILEEALQVPAPFTWGTNIIVWILLGMFGDTLYLRHAKLKITSIKMRFVDPQMQRAQIAKIGGTTWGSVLALLIVVLVLVVLGALAQT
jgi:hypothetical protein